MCESGSVPPRNVLRATCMRVLRPSTVEQSLLPLYRTGFACFSNFICFGGGVVVVVVMGWGGVGWGRRRLTVCRCLIVTQLLLVSSSAVLYESFKQLVLEQYKRLSCFIINCSCVRRATNQGANQRLKDVPGTRKTKSI